MKKITVLEKSISDLGVRTEYVRTEYDSGDIYFNTYKYYKEHKFIIFLIYKGTTYSINYFDYNKFNPHREISTTRKKEEIDNIIVEFVNSLASNDNNSQ